MSVLSGRLLLERINLSCWLGQMKLSIIICIKVSVVSWGWGGGGGRVMVRTGCNVFFNPKINYNKHYKTFLKRWGVSAKQGYIVKNTLYIKCKLPIANNNSIKP